jgi:hypothetical protein
VLYLDGEEVDREANAQTGDVLGGNQLIIGSTHRNLYDEFDGKFDDARIYHRALDDDEIAEIYAAEDPETEYTTGDHNRLTSDGAYAYVVSVPPTPAKRRRLVQSAIFAKRGSRTHTM